MKETEIIGTQDYTNAHLFEQWCVNFFDLTNLIENEYQLDSHHCRWFYIAIWDLFLSGERYVSECLALPSNSICEYLTTAREYIEKLKALYDDTDYFMLQYYRHSSAHIFQSEYSLVDKTKTPKSSMRFSSFYNKSGVKDRKLTQSEIRDEVKKIIGVYGLGEATYRRSLISRSFPIIKEWNQKHSEILKEITL